MANFLTTGRAALLTVLQADVTLAAGIQTWYDWGPGLKKRFGLEPSRCPILSLVPADLDQDQLSNAAERFPQDLALEIATHGQDAEPCEEYLVAALAVVKAADRNCLDLAADGLAQVRPLSVHWEAMVTKESPDIIWLVTMIVRNTWLRR